MTADAYLVLRCDGRDSSGGECDAETHLPVRTASHTELRRIRRADGWRTRRSRSGGPLFDFCPNHAKKPTPSRD